MTRLFVKGDVVRWNSTVEMRSPLWDARKGKLAEVLEDQGRLDTAVQVRFMNERDFCMVKHSSCTLTEARKPTIHDEARQKFSLAMTYGEDGAISTAAGILEDIARMYRTRANAIASEIDTFADHKQLGVDKPRPKRRRTTTEAKS